MGDIRERGRKVEKPSVKLPAGYELYEEEDFVHLVCGDEFVAVFSSVGVEPAEIVEATRCHQARR